MVLAGEVARFVALVIGGMSVAVSLVVVVEYARVYRVHRRITPGDWRGLLPRHVFLIGVAHIGLTLLVMREVYLLLDRTLTWFGPAAIVLFVAGLWAQWDMLGHQSHRLHASPGDEHWWRRRRRRR